jgi:hypothetical protein
MKWKDKKGEQGPNADARAQAKKAKADANYQRDLEKLGPNPNPKEKAKADAEYNVRTATSPEGRAAAKKQYAKALAERGKPPIKNPTQTVKTLNASAASLGAVATVKKKLFDWFGF